MRFPLFQSVGLCLIPPNIVPIYHSIYRMGTGKSNKPKDLETQNHPFPSCPGRAVFPLHHFSHFEKIFISREGPSLMERNFSGKPSGGLFLSFFLFVISMSYPLC
jgi:hypothetical protein